MDDLFKIVILYCQQNLVISFLLKISFFLFIWLSFLTISFKLAIYEWAVISVNGVCVCVSVCVSVSVCVCVRVRRGGDIMVIEVQEQAGVLRGRVIAVLTAPGVSEYGYVSHTNTHINNHTRVHTVRDTNTKSALCCHKPAQTTSALIFEQKISQSNLSAWQKTNLNI